MSQEKLSPNDSNDNNSGDDDYVMIGAVPVEKAKAKNVYESEVKEKK